MTLVLEVSIEELVEEDAQRTLGDLRGILLLERAVLSIVAGVSRVATVGDVPVAASAALDEASLLLIGAETVLARGDIVAPAGATAAARAALTRGATVYACADAWAGWSDDVPPPLPAELEIVPRELLSRVIGSAN